MTGERKGLNYDGKEVKISREEHSSGGTFLFCCVLHRFILLPTISCKTRVIWDTRIHLIKLVR